MLKYKEAVKYYKLSLKFSKDSKMNVELFLKISKILVEIF